MSFKLTSLGDGVHSGDICEAECNRVKSQANQSSNECSLAISRGVGDGDPHGSKDTRVVDALETTGVPENSHMGIRTSPLKKVAGSIAQLQCICTDARSMGNKQEELEAIVQLENYDTVAITETW